VAVRHPEKTPASGIVSPGGRHDSPSIQTGDGLFIVALPDRFHAGHGTLIDPLGQDRFNHRKAEGDHCIESRNSGQTLGLPKVWTGFHGYNQRNGKKRTDQVPDNPPILLLLQQEQIILIVLLGVLPELQPVKTNTGDHTEGNHRKQCQHKRR